MEIKSSMISYKSPTAAKSHTFQPADAESLQTVDSFVQNQDRMGPGYGSALAEVGGEVISTTLNIMIGGVGGAIGGAALGAYAASAANYGALGIVGITLASGVGGTVVGGYLGGKI